MSVVMRAKMYVAGVNEFSDLDGNTTSELLTLSAVCKEDGPYPADGTDENNTFAKWTPFATLTMTVTNPALFGKIKTGQKFYVDFWEAN